MAGLTRCLRRLVVVGASTAAIAIGVAPMAEAAPPPFYPPTGNGVTSVQVSPESDTANVNICNPYTITMTSTQQASITVEIRQSATATASGDKLTIGFCSPFHGNDSSTTVGAQPSPDSTTATSSGDNCTTAAATASGQTMTEGCEAQFLDADGDKKIIVGVISDHPGTMNVHAFTDQNGDGVEQFSEKGFTAHKTWTAASATSNDNRVTCEPASDTNPSGTVHTFTCTVTDTQDQPVSGARVNFKVTSGPDAGQTARCSGGTTSRGISSEPGTTTCQYKNTGPVGHDVIDVWVDTTDNNLHDTGEPSTTITKDWVQPAPNGSTLTLSCSPNQTTTTGTDPTCQESTSQSSVTITALVQNGTPAQPQAGYIVLFDQPTDTSPAGKSDSSDSESVSPTSCTTGMDGKCSVTFTDSHPSDGESFTVKASLPRQGQADATATATIVYHNPTKGEARNIVVSPHTVSKQAGGVQPFSATVTDRFSHPVAGVLVSWSETGAGAFRAGGSTAQCTTDANGTCSVEVTTVATETGDETVTATIDPSNYSGANNQECTAPANKTYVAPSNSANPGDAPGARAGNCSDKGTVTWTAGSPPPPQKQDPVLNCFSPRKHVLKCKVVSNPRVIGAGVTFRKVHADGTLGKVIAQRTTNTNGVAKFRKGHLRSGKLWRVIAKVHRSGDIRGGLSNVSKARIR